MTEEAVRTLAKSLGFVLAHMPAEPVPFLLLSGEDIKGGDGAFICTERAFSTLEQVSQFLNLQVN